MKDFIEILINRLEEEKGSESEYFTAEGKSLVRHWNNCVDVCKEIVKHFVEEYNNGWINASVEIPSTNRYILLSFYNFSVPQIGRYEEDEEGGAFYIGDDTETCVSQDLFVNAWMELPEPYKEKDGEKQRYAAEMSDLISISVLIKTLNEYVSKAYDCNGIDDKSVIEYQQTHEGKTSYIIQGFSEVYEILQDLPTAYNNGWIPCTERLPEEKINPITMDYYEYPVLYENNGVKDIRHYKYGNGHWHHGLTYMDDYVVAWYELPEYKEKEGENDVRM